MAITNYERVGKALELLKAGLAPFVEREMKSCLKDGVTPSALRNFVDDPMIANKPISEWDAAALLKLMWDSWNDVFRNTLGFAERSLVSEIREVRNNWAHQQPFSSDDADRALDSMARLLTAVSATPESEEISKMKMELRRLIFDEQMRSEKRRNAGTAIDSLVTGSLKPWREVVNPHKDVASGNYQQAEFAADLYQVYIGEGTAEYSDPAEFFRRTYLTESLNQLLTCAMQRLSGKGGDPVVQLQTNFGGGKTHSMLALYHLFSGTSAGELLGVDTVMMNAGIDKLPTVKRVVLVGNKISAGNPTVKADGTVVRTLWGELAWQLGGKEAFQKIQADDEKATSPGDALRELMNEYGPCLILIDEWVAYARQLHDNIDLPGGNFETHFSFAQALTESAKLAKQCLLVVSLPASDTATVSPHSKVDDVEVGGERGRAALERLRNAVGRVEASWRPANAEEGFEIVRRRLFEPIIDNAQFVTRDTVADAFYELYRTNSHEFPQECSESDYKKRLKAAYPIHPEVFDRLYTDWSTLVKFQRTRGVLRLMAAVIHSLWDKGDRNALIMPANISIDDPRVQNELTRYLSDNWTPVIERDVDGPNALPQRIDSEVANLGKYKACRRVARTIYLGSAPMVTASNRGLEDRRIRLGCAMPGEPLNVFGDALRRLSVAATYLYHDGVRYWYSTQPTVAKLAEDRAEQYKRNPDAVVKEIEKRIREDVVRGGSDFYRIHALPKSGQDVPDDMDTRLVILGIDTPYSRQTGNPAEIAAKEIFEFRGNSPRLYRNTLVFLAVDQARLQDLDEAIRRYLAWDSILKEKESLNLDPHQSTSAENQKRTADSSVSAQLPEAYHWLIVPVQKDAKSAIEWQAIKLSGNYPLAERASKKMRNDELLATSFAGTLLRMALDNVPLWRGDSVPVKQLAEDFASYVYLQRLKNASVLVGAVRDGLGLPNWQQDSFAYADSWDETAGRYRGLRGGKTVDIYENNPSGLLVKPDVAKKQLDEEAMQAAATSSAPAPVNIGTSQPTFPTLPGSGSSSPMPPLQQKSAPKPKRFHGSVTLEDTRVGRDASKIAEEVIAHLVSLQGANVKVTLEIEAELPNGTPDNVVRIVTENCRSLKFNSQGFEEE
jgi:predicted AAA+ superfamily ATPase